MGKSAKLPIVFLDRDGTIIVDKVYLNNPDEVEFIDGVIDGLKKLVKARYKLVIVTNQSGVSRGLVQVENLYAIHDRICKELRRFGVEIFKIYYCPHLPEDNCGCRKPKTGMIKEIESLIDKENSYVIGDKQTDIGFGKNLGIKTILISADEISKDLNYVADFVVKNFVEAVNIVLGKKK